MLLLSNFGQIYNYREVVAVTIEVSARCVCALGIAFVLTAALLEEVFVENLRLEILECRAVVAYEIGRYDDLVEEIPTTLVSECAIALFVESPHGVEVATFGNILGIFDSTENVGAAIVVGVVVEVAHDDNL